MPTLAVTIEAASTSPSASAPFVKRHIRVHRISPHVRDDREPPLDRSGLIDVRYSPIAIKFRIGAK
jgi:hypothetical protein